MDSFPTAALAVEWEFRCLGKDIPGHPWDWRCKSADGRVIAQANRYFKSLREAVADASGRGFNYQSGRGASRGATGLARANTTPV